MHPEIRNEKLASGLSKMKGSYFNISKLLKEKKKKEKEVDATQFSSKKDRLHHDLTKVLKIKAFGRMLDNKKGKILSEVLFED
jgi:hypothetical protein